MFFPSNMDKKSIVIGMVQHYVYHQPKVFVLTLKLTALLLFAHFLFYLRED